MMLSVTSQYFYLFFELFAAKEIQRSTVRILLIYVRFIVIINVIDVSFFKICIARPGTMDENQNFL